ncbi:hypothetical protein KGP40_09300 [Weissella cibaria]|nr:hypothetical protein [Weissella cibaria]
MASDTPLLFMLSPQGGNRPIQYVSKVLGHVDTKITTHTCFEKMQIVQQKTLFVGWMHFSEGGEI